ncbi:MAG: SMC family ATPase [Candidatus Melainabacteria bacterium]|nr:SMC family ATPase [Candidatus Melainabacteria bacterium]
MSYSNAEIDFSGIHVACLSGANGAGKSSLLDAVTWALWEEGRARTDELIKLGKDEMFCELEFFIEGELYRVYRSRSKAFKNSQGKSNLEFQIFNPKEQNWTSLSMSSVRQTQDLIIKTIKMDYGTFVNSVYLRQGKADEFTLKRPNERKQILADILGLEVYDRLCESARVKIRESEQTLSLEQNLVLNLEEKILKEDELKLSLESVNSELSLHESELKNINQLLESKEKELNEKKEKEKQIQTLEKSKINQESLIKTLEGQLKNIKDKEEKCKQLIDTKLQIQKEHNDYLKLKEKLEIIEQEKDLYSELLQDKSMLEQKLKDKIKQTEQELAVYKSKITDRSTLRDKLQNMLKNESIFESFLPRAEGEIKTFHNLQESLVKIETEGLELKHKKELLLSNLEKLGERKKEIKSKIQTLSSHSHSEPCPLCKSPVKDREKVIESYNLEIQNLDKEEQSLTKDIELKENEVKEKRNKYTETKQKIDGFGKVIAAYVPELSKIKAENIDIETFEKIEGQKAISAFKSQLEIAKSEFQKTKSQLVVVDKEISGYENEVNSLDNLLVSGSLVKEISEKLSIITGKLNNLKYDPKAYGDLKISLKEKENIVLIYNSLLRAESEVLLLKGESKELAEKIKSGCSEIEGLKSLIEDSKKQIENITVLFSEVSELKSKQLEKNHKTDEIKRQRILAEQSLLEIKNSKQLIKDKKNKLSVLLNDKKYFEILEKAFSKNGIQVAVIETIVPEIEKEANKILSRLTENQMHVALKTQREKKSTTGLVETLDVVIADNMGTRNYELYSGGEAFKIDFSLRLALSRLLANRACAKLQTLIIDEGFGSQDSSGRERLVEVIKSIQNEFELILVVTHIDELKESFPVQIQVTKNEEGSRVKLVA